MQLLSTMYFNLSGIQSRIGKKKESDDLGNVFIEQICGGLGAVFPLHLGGSSCNSSCQQLVYTGIKGWVLPGSQEQEMERKSSSVLHVYSSQGPAKEQEQSCFCGWNTPPQSTGNGSIAAKYPLTFLAKD